MYTLSNYLSKNRSLYKKNPIIYSTNAPPPSVLQHILLILIMFVTWLYCKILFFKFFILVKVKIFLNFSAQQANYIHRFVLISSFLLIDGFVTISSSIFHYKSIFAVDLDFILSADKLDITSLGPVVWKQRATNKRIITKDT